jgi:hypothetical protein
MRSVLMCLLLTGCGTYYPRCDESRLMDFRCSGTTIEMCTGSQWSEQRDCAKMTVNGVATPQQCVSDGSNAYCGGSDENQ